MAKYRYIYRDRNTGRFAKKTTWKRSKAHDGTRYKRKRIKKKLPPPVPPLPPPKEIVYEWLVVFTYQESGRTFDIISTATNNEEAQDVAQIYLRSDQEAKKMFDIRGKLKRGWTMTVAQTAHTREAVGEAEYRSESKQ